MSEPERAARPRWPERALLVAAVALLAAGLLSIPLRRALVPPSQLGITGEVSGDLEPASHIAAEPGSLRGFNLLVITTDTTRADHLGPYGNRSVTTPTLDRLAREGVLFANAITPSPSTLPAHSSLMTGLYPIHHGARANGSFRLEDRVTTLAERLGGAGYRTGAVISAFVLDGRFGLKQGFATYHDDLTKGVKLSNHMFRERPGELTNEPAIAWLRDQVEAPFFLWVHYFDPHAAYLPPEPFRSDYAADPYDGEIAYADSRIGALLAELAQQGQLERTLVVYTADHGEGLGEHGEQTHSLLTYDATLHVPLIFHAPAGLPKGKAVPGQASLVDVVPTVLSLLGMEVPEGLDGRDLSRPPAGEPRPHYFETIAPMTLHGWAPLMGVRSDDYKYILAPTPELYDLNADPLELENLHEAKPEIAARMREELVAVVGGDPLVAAQVDANLSMDDDTRAQLAALGYVQTIEELGDAAARQAFDPKEMVFHWEEVQRGINLQAQGKPTEALPILEKAVAQVEGDLFARAILANAYRMRGEYDKALTLYHRSAELSPKDEGILLSIAGIHLARGELEEAQAQIGAVQEFAPESPALVSAQARLAMVQGDPEEAQRLYEQVIAMDPGTSGPSAYVAIGWIHLRAHRLEEARQAFRSAIKIDALNGMARDGLANVAIREEKLEDAARLLALALRFDPNQPRALSTLAALLSRGEDQDEALRIAERALELSPRFAEAHDALGLIHRRRDQHELAEKHYHLAIEYGPYLERPHVNLAQLYMRQGKQDAAIEEFRSALRVNRFSRIALANLGAYHFNEGREEEALRFYRLALRVDPEYALVHRNLGSLYAERDHPKRAAHHLRRTLELEPLQPGAEKLRYQLQLAESAAAENPDASVPEETSTTEGS